MTKWYDENAEISRDTTKKHSEEEEEKPVDIFLIFNFYIHQFVWCILFVHFSFTKQKWSFAFSAVASRFLYIISS